MNPFKTLFVLGVLAVGVLHPIIHQFELGSLDTILDYLNMIAANVAQNLKGTKTS